MHFKRFPLVRIVRSGGYVADVAVIISFTLSYVSVLFVDVMVRGSKGGAMRNESMEGD